VLQYDDELGYAYGPVTGIPAAAEQEELGGVLRPVWSEKVDVAVTFRPTLRTLSDGSASAFAFATPETYAAPDATSYRLPGRFSSAGSDISRAAHLSFAHTGQMTSLIGMGSLGSAGARALNPQPGDTFTPEGQVLLPPQQPGDAWGEGVCQMTPLTFPETPFWWETCPLPPHTYLAGLVVADLMVADPAVRAVHPCRPMARRLWWNRRRVRRRRSSRPSNAAGNGSGAGCFGERGVRSGELGI
jgi:hypothetical protein